jgi:hypothetical protein
VADVDSPLEGEGPAGDLTAIVVDDGLVLDFGNVHSFIDDQAGGVREGHYDEHDETVYEEAQKGDSDFEDDEDVSDGARAEGVQASQELVKEAAAITGGDLEKRERPRISMEVKWPSLEDEDIADDVGPATQNLPRDQQSISSMLSRGPRRGPQ